MALRAVITAAATTAIGFRPGTGFLPRVAGRRWAGLRWADLGVALLVVLRVRVPELDDLLVLRVPVGEDVRVAMSQNYAIFTPVPRTTPVRVARRLSGPELE
ncbi:hypothetical protein Back2_01210 [Nocardioides baekrokdamisoli]|uniref:Uncharacterized protein n=1 Tax=Nocardioides baekrokdamisoli TaxID=1804624 RepID=A0A3G9IXD9_9ACTN|nr:hypothetical protein Back2_01210 [Nocardioides baekrokdamisoli]